MKKKIKTGWALVKKDKSMFGFCDIGVWASRHKMLKYLRRYPGDLYTQARIEYRITQVQP